MAALAFRVGERWQVDRIAALVYGAVEVGPPTPHADAGLVHPPAGRAWPTPVPSKALLDLGRVALHPAIDRGVVDLHTALLEPLLQLAGAHPVLAVPAHRPQDDLTLEVPTLEVVHQPAATATL